MTALHFNDLTPPGTTQSHWKDRKTQLLDHSRTTGSAHLRRKLTHLDRYLARLVVAHLRRPILGCHRFPSPFRRRRLPDPGNEARRLLAASWSLAGFDHEPDLYIQGGDLAITALDSRDAEGVTPPFVGGAAYRNDGLLGTIGS